MVDEEAAGVGAGREMEGCTDTDGGEYDRVAGWVITGAERCMDGAEG